MVIIIGLLTIASFCLIYCIIRYVQRRHSNILEIILEIFYEAGFESVCWCLLGYPLTASFFKTLLRKSLRLNLFMNWYVCVNEILKCSKGWKVPSSYYSMFSAISGTTETENHYHALNSEITGKNSNVHSYQLK